MLDWRLPLVPYDPVGAMRSRARAALDTIIAENERALAQYKWNELSDTELAKRRAWRKQWYKNGGKEICAKNGRDRRKRLKKEGKL